jgi:hypothetical protein
MKTMCFAVLVVTGIASSAGAQGSSTVVVARKAEAGQAPQVSTYTFERKVATDQAPQVLLDKIRMDEGQILVESRTTPNAPYSGETANESVQVLPDGNRIVHRTVTRVYRDGAGRTRRETLDADGQVALVAIIDPTTGVSVVVDPKTNKVSRSTVMKWTSGGPVDGPAAATHSAFSTAVFVTADEKTQADVDLKTRVKVAEAGGGAGNVFYVNGGPETLKGETTKEDLGQQTIEGVVASGTRTTTVIPAGAIGNDQPVKVVSEEWFSPDLQVLVLTRHSDPRTGESTYRLSNIVRGDQPKALFEPPAGPVVR